jgi:pyruvate dehydrogenase E2 component (dihydrolipoamide acetyltransferase)
VSGELRLPALTPTMTEGAVARWLVNVGDVVEEGQVIAEVETDKTVVEIVAFQAGTIADILVPAGSEPVPVDTPIARFAGGEAEALAQPAPPAETLEYASVKIPQRDPAERVRSSPAARRAAHAAGLDAATLHGTGPSGRVVRLDVERAAGAMRTATAELPTLLHERPFERQRLSMMRRSIAERMSRAKREVPHFYLRADLDMTAVIDLHAQRQGMTTGSRWSLNDAVVRAAALALREVPALNVEFAADHVRQYACVDVAIAVAVAGGLMTPVVRDADRKPLAELAAETRDLAARARDGRLQPVEYSGGTLTVSNLGMHGVREFSAILNPPQAAILAVGAVEPRPVVRAEGVMVAQVCTVVLSCDHRVVDGTVAAAFLAALRRLIESPASLLR